MMLKVKGEVGDQKNYPQTPKYIATLNVMD